MAEKRTRVSSVEWWLVDGFLWMIDGVQALFDVFLVGVAANRYIDIIVGLSFCFYLVIRRQIDMQMGIALLATFLGEEIPGVDAMPFWGLDGYYSMKRARAKEAAEDQMEEQEAQARVAAEIAKKRSAFMARSNGKAV